VAGYGSRLAVLVVNAGSTSLKLHLVRGDESKPIASLEDARDIDVVAHRIVHGGQRYRDPVVVDDEFERALLELQSLAPLHEAPTLVALRDARARLPDVPHVAVFDTAFHATIPAEAATYAVPRRWREQWGIHRYGFHGLSVEWAAEQVPVERLVVCHLGGGCSVTAVHAGRSVDTTMGFTPLEGVPMATRSGSVDPGALLYVVRVHGLTIEELDHALERESGLAALGGLDEPLGFGVYTYRIAAAVGAMATALGGIDALVFTAGVGENRADVRDAICARLEYLGVGTRADVHVIPAREEIVAARHARRLVAAS
jgi:acetate kinase